MAAARGARIIVFGPERELTAALAGLDTVVVVDAPVMIGNHEEPGAAVREKSDASIVLAARAVADGRADALVSAGATGATFAAALFNVKRIRGVMRPALAVQLPVETGGRALLLDAGANVEAGADLLAQFALMGSLFATTVMGIERPRVGLLSVGEEAGKGTASVAAAHDLLTEMSDAGVVDFHGNAEGRDITGGAFDVIVTDGFTGNIALKAIEGAARTVAGQLSTAIRSSPVARAGGLMIRSRLAPLRERLDPNATGGALLLGLRRPVVVAHGSASARGIDNAIALAERSVREDAAGRMTAAFEHTVGAAPRVEAARAAASGRTDNLPADDDA